MKVIVIYQISFLCGSAALDDGPLSEGDLPFSEEDVRLHADLADWLHLWTPPMDHFAASSFQLARESKEIGWPIHDFSVRSASFPPRHMDRLLYSPNGTWAIDFWFGQVDSGGTVLGEPDSYVALLNLTSDQAHLLLECGTPCGFHLATWLSESSFLVCGWQEYEADSLRRIQPVVHRFELQDQGVRTFLGPPMSQEYVAPLEKAVRAWWSLRHPWIRWEQSN